MTDSPTVPGSVGGGDMGGGGESGGGLLVAPAGTDQGRGDRIARVMIERRSHRWVVEAERWYRWTGTHWEDDSAQASYDSLAVSLALTPTPGEAGGAAKPDRCGLSHTSIRAALARAAMRPELRVPVARLDRHPTLLATPSGTIDLAAGRLRPADPDDLLSRCTPVGVDFHLGTPGWNELLGWVSGRDPDMVAWLQRLAGMVVCGQVLEHRLIVIYGPSRTGKSTFLQVLTRLLGSMAVTLPAAMISSRRPMFSTELEYRKADLRGARLAAAYESEDGGILDEAAVKTLTSSDPITARVIRQEPITFTPSHTTILATNQRPNVISDDDAIWNRLVLVPFSRPCPPDRQDRHLVDRLIGSEGPGILAWAARGAAAYLADGLGTCAAVEAATGEYRQEQDLVGRFLSECCLVRPGVRVAQGDLMACWESWCQQQRIRPWSLRSLKDHLRRRGATSGDYRSNGVRYVVGVGLLAHQP